ncbi:hypothetical protein ACFL2H_05505 [Planctomycetota bacterium]
MGIAVFGIAEDTTAEHSIAELSGLSASARPTPAAVAGRESAIMNGIEVSESPT